MDAVEQERRNVANLIRWLAGFIAFPSLTIGGAFVLFAFDEHRLHALVLVPLGLAALAIGLAAPRLARRFVADTP